MRQTAQQEQASAAAEAATIAWIETMGAWAWQKGCPCQRHHPAVKIEYHKAWVRGWFRAKREFYPDELFTPEDR